MDKKQIKEYLDKYAEVPRDYSERFAKVIALLNIKDKDLGHIRSGIQKLLNVSRTRTNFVFYVIPKATPRARRSGRTGIFYVKNASDNSKMFKTFIDEHGESLGLVHTPCHLYVDVYLPIPSGMTRKEKVWAELKLIEAIGKPDWDNVGKTYSDMIQKYYLVEDALVTRGVVRKYYSFLPRVEITVDYQDEYDCNYHKRKIEGWKTYKESYKEIEEKASSV